MLTYLHFVYILTEFRMMHIYSMTLKQTDCVKCEAKNLFMAVFRVMQFLSVALPSDISCASCEYDHIIINIVMMCIMHFELSEIMTNEHMITVLVSYLWQKRVVSDTTTVEMLRE